MVEIDLKKQAVGIHLSCSITPDPVFYYHAFAKNGCLEARGSLTMSIPGNQEKATIFIDRRHLDSLINYLSDMRDEIDQKEEKVKAL